MKPYEPARISIKQWAEEDRPREKLLLKGKAALSDAELVGILLGSGTKSLSAVDLAKHVLSHADNNLNQLARWTVKDLMKFNGIGEAKAISIVSALELGRRRKAEEIQTRPKLKSSRLAFEYIKGDLEDLLHEEFWVIMLKRNNEVIKKMQVSAGGIAGTVADIRLIFKQAIQELASNLILVHNHPSGNLKPSDKDIHLTRKFVEAGHLLEIKVLDHLIVTQSNYYSFRDDGMI